MEYPNLEILGYKPNRDDLEEKPSACRIQYKSKKYTQLTNLNWNRSSQADNKEPYGLKPMLFLSRLVL